MKTINKILVILVLSLVFGFAGAQVTTSGLTQISGQLDFGARGAQVTALQQFLAQYPQYYPEGLVTGYYGSLTQAAVVRFQAANGFEQVGRVGPLTLARINSIIGGGVVPGTGVDNSAPFISNINAQRGTTSGTSASLVINWTTDTPSRGIVYYSTVPLQVTENSSMTEIPIISGTSLTSNSGYVISNSVTIPNLTQNATYYYRIVAIDQAGNVSVSNASSTMTGF